MFLWIQAQKKYKYFYTYIHNLFQSNENILWNDCYAETSVICRILHEFNHSDLNNGMQTSVVSDNPW